MQFLPSDEGLEYLARVLVVVLLLQDDRACRSASGTTNGVVIKNVPKHNFGHVFFNIRQKTNLRIHKCSPEP